MFDLITVLINKPLFNILNSLINFNFYLDRIELHQKKPGTSITPPHQDNFYFGLDLKKNFALTAYVALNDQNEEMGSLGFYPGSNHENFNHHPSNVIGFSSGIDVKDLKDKKLDAAWYPWTYKTEYGSRVKKSTSHAIILVLRLQEIAENDGTNLAIVVLD